jgi:hypothetical protein
MGSGGGLKPLNLIALELAIIPERSRAFETILPTHGTESTWHGAERPWATMRSQKKIGVDSKLLSIINVGRLAFMG